MRIRVSEREIYTIVFVRKKCIITTETRRSSVIVVRVTKRIRLHYDTTCLICTAELNSLQKHIKYFTSKFIIT